MRVFPSIVNYLHSLLLCNLDYPEADIYSSLINVANDNVKSPSAIEVSWFCASGTTSWGIQQNAVNDNGTWYTTESSASF